MKATPANPEQDQREVVGVVMLIHRRRRLHRSVSYVEAAADCGSHAVRLAAASGYVRSDGIVLALTQQGRELIERLEAEGQRRAEEAPPAAHSRDGGETEC